METLAPENFYDELAGLYDGMTNFESRIEKTQQILKDFRNRFNLSSAIDVACGTGLYTCALESIGVPTTGVDISDQMLNKAKKHAAKLGVTPRWIKAAMENLPDKLNTSADAIFCLGNSLPHIPDENQLYYVATKFSALLNKNGFLVLQLLNYSSILASRQRIVNITQANKKNIVRFYDFIDPVIQFNILTSWQDKGTFHHKMQSTKLFPYTNKQIIKILNKAKFSNINTYSSLDFKPFDESKSKDLVIVAQT